MMATMDWAGVVVGLGGLGVAALTLWLTYRERTKWYRERVYDQQLDACLAICRVSAEVNAGVWSAAFQAALARTAKTEIPTDRWAHMDKHSARLVTLQRRWAPILPDATSAALISFQNATSHFRGMHDLAPIAFPEPDSDESQGSMTEVDSNFAALLQAARTDLGVKRLSDETLRLIGNNQDSRLRATLKAAAEANRSGRG